MLKKRIIANLAVKDGIVVQSRQFRSYLPVGKPEIAAAFLNSWGIDEIILNDISATKSSRGPDFEMVKRVAAKCQVPLTVGGGISNTAQIGLLLNCGADKVFLNNALLTNPELVSKAASTFGEQCIVASIDAIENGENFFAFDYTTQKNTRLKAAELAIKAQKLGAGEILINSVERDGIYLGYDEKLVNSICASVSVPVIALGGARNAGDMLSVLKNTNASAAAAGNFFHFSEHSVVISKSVISSQIPLRFETQASYRNNPLDDNYRILKKDDKVLEELLFVKIENEVI